MREQWVDYQRDELRRQDVIAMVERYYNDEPNPNDQIEDSQEFELLPEHVVTVSNTLPDRTENFLTRPMNTYIEQSGVTQEYIFLREVTPLPINTQVSDELLQDEVG